MTLSPYLVELEALANRMDDYPRNEDQNNYYKVIRPRIILALAAVTRAAQELDDSLTCGGSGYLCKAEMAEKLHDALEKLGKACMSNNQRYRDEHANPPSEIKSIPVGKPSLGDVHSVIAALTAERDQLKARAEQAEKDAKFFLDHIRQAVIMMNDELRARAKLYDG